MDAPFPIASIFASLAVVAGLALLYLRWKERKRHDRLARYGVAGGWGLIAAGIVLWAISGRKDIALSVAVCFVMAAALVFVILHGLRLPAPRRQTRARPDSERDGLDLGAGYWSRFMARLFGSLVVAPLFGAAAGAFSRKLAFGFEADRLMIMAFVMLFATAAALVGQLFAARPWRACAGLAVAAVLLATPVYAPMLWAS